MEPVTTKAEPQRPQREAWRTWAEVEARLNEMSASADGVGRLARAVRFFAWTDPNCPKHD